MMDLAKRGWGCLDWIDVFQDRYTFLSSCECGNEPLFHRMLGNYRMATQLVAPCILLSSTELLYSHCS
jgi:hypothetical protein